MPRKKNSAQAAQPTDAVTPTSEAPAPVTEQPTPPTETPTAAPAVLAEVLESSTPPPADAPKPAFAERVQRADPFPFHTVTFPDGYQIHLQESDSRRTLEIQFNEGAREDRPQNFAKIKALLLDAGMRWNGTNAWQVELSPVRGTLAQREDAKRCNRDIRTEIEEHVFPAVIGLEEEVRGEIPLTDDYRQRIATVRSGNGRA